MRSLKFFLSRSSLEKMYISFVRPIIEYSNVVWDNCSNFLKIEIELIHHEAARIVSGATKLCNINKLLNDLKWDSLEKRRQNHKLILFYKMQNNLTPSYLTDLLPSNNAVGAYNLRNTRSVNARTESYRSSFLPSTIRAWNALPQPTRESSSIAIFKHRLNINLGKPSTLFNIVSRRGQILHTRLRLDCSSLNYDLHRKSIIKSPRCTCGESESYNTFC